MTCDGTSLIASSQQTLGFPATPAGLPAASANRARFRENPWRIRDSRPSLRNAPTEDCSSSVQPALRLGRVPFRVLSLPPCWVDHVLLRRATKSLLNETFGADETRLRPRGTSGGHTRNFLDCVKSRATTIAPSEAAHRSAPVGHLGQISMLLGRKIHFNPETEEITDDATASRMLGSALRSPWHL